MAKKVRRSKKTSKKADFEVSDGVKQSLIAVAVIAAGMLFLLSFGGLAGTAGMYIDNALANVFGWARWFFAVVLLILGWQAIFPDKEIFTPMRIFGVTIFFLSFCGLLHLLLIGLPTPQASELLAAGGYIGLFISRALTGFMGFWGGLLVTLTGFILAIVLVFNVSLGSVLTVHRHFTGIGRLMHRKQLARDEGDEDAEEEDEFDEYEDEYEEEVQEDEEDDEYEEDEVDQEKKKRAAAVRKKQKESKDSSESVMTSKRRRRMEIPIDLLDEIDSEPKAGDVEKNEEILERTFANFGIDVEIVDVRVGPNVTQYALRPAEGVKLSRIVALNNDLALALAAHPIRIEAPIPGRSLVGVEVPNQAVAQVGLHELLSSKQFKRRKSDYSVALGKDVSGATSLLGVDKAPHLLVAGATGSGKSVCLNILITSLLYQNGPDDLKFIMVDPKRVELGVYTGIPHLLVPPITKVDEAINALKWGVREMERRLDHLAKSGARDIDSYNAKNKERMPKIVIVIDELADLMSQNKRDVEAVIVRIAQMARAVGIHLVLATQRPSVDVITGLIKANIPSRVAFAVASQVDSKTILDVAGADKLLGRGDMLLSTPRLSKPKRLQGAYISDEEIDRVVTFLKEHGEPDYNYQVTEDTKTGGTVFDSKDADDLLEQAIQIILDSGKASTSFLQRRLSIGYSRAARIIDMMEDLGIISAQNGSKPRNVLVTSWPPGSEADQAEEEATEPEDEEDYDSEKDYDETEEDNEQENEGYEEEEADDDEEIQDDGEEDGEEDEYDDEYHEEDEDDE